jgi:dsDNA-specific endonuclease/ATPase MutS2
MFISKKEKIHIQNAIESLRFGLADATTEILYLKAKVKVLEEKNAPKPVKMTEEELKEELKKARQRAYGRAYYQRKKEREQVLHVGS